MTDKRFKKIVTLLIAGSTVLASVIVWLSVHSNARAAAAGRDSRIEAIKFLTFSGQALWNLALEKKLMVSYRELSSLEQLEGVYAAMAKPREAVFNRMAQERLSRLMDSLKPFGALFQPPYFASGPAGFDFFQLYLDKVFVPAVELQQRQDLKKTESGFWSKKNESYSAALTVLAVAVFLLTLSLTISGRIRHIFLSTGILLALALGGFVADTARLPFHSPPSDEVRAFARASGRLLYAQTLKLGSGLDRAVDVAGAALKELDGILARDPAYAECYPLRAYAHLARGESLLFKGEAAGSKREIGLAITDFRKAIRSGSRDGYTLWNLGYAELLDGRYVQSERDYRQALSLLPEQRLGLGVNIALSLLLEGRTSEAGDDLDHTVRYAQQHPLASDPLYFRTAIRNLERFGGIWANPRIGKMAKRLKEAFVCIQFLKRPLPPVVDCRVDPLLFVRPQYDANGKIVSLSEQSVFPPLTSRVDYIFSYRGLKKGFHLVQKVYATAPGEPFRREQPILEKSEIWSGSEEGRSGWTIDFPLPGAGQGLSVGRYLVELYVQGNLLSRGEFEIR